MNFGFSMIANHLFGDAEFSQLCQDMSTVRYDGERLKENADFVNTHMKIYINGNPVKITEVTQGKGNNHNDYCFGQVNLTGQFNERKIKSMQTAYFVV